MNELQEQIHDAVEEQDYDGAFDGLAWCEENDVDPEDFAEAVDTMEMYEAGVEFGVSPRFPWYREHEV